MIHLDIFLQYRVFFMQQNRIDTAIRSNMSFVGGSQNKLGIPCDKIYLQSWMISLCAHKQSAHERRFMGIFRFIHTCQINGNLGGTITVMDLNTSFVSF